MKLTRKGLFFAKIKDELTISIILFQDRHFI